MRRGLILAGVWALGVAVALTLAFAAVGRVANGVAPRDVARLSSSEIHDALTGPTTNPISSSSVRPNPGTTTTTGSSAPTTTTSSSTTTSTSRPTGSTIAGATTMWTTTTTTTTTTAAPPHTVPITATTTTTTPPVAPHNTVTTAQGGTVFTRCSGAGKIVYVAAVPQSGYERTVDIENEGGIEQVFVNAHHRSQIQAECSGGVVHAQVEEESTDE